VSSSATVNFKTRLEFFELYFIAGKGVKKEFFSLS
jgi:hypothetical protein